MNRRLGGFKIKDDYIQKFALKDRGKEAVFLDICIGIPYSVTNDEPTNTSI